MNLLDRIVEFENGELDFKETIDLFAELVKTGLAWTLQGQYGRTAKSFIEGGFISSTGQVLKRSYIISSYLEE